MSSQRGNTSRSRPQAHQNLTSFHHNKASRLTKKIAENSGRFQELLCPACKQIIDWRKAYRKYKPLTVPKKCTRCGQKAITQAYHAVCPNCARANKICAKCCQPFEASLEPAEAVPTDPVAALVQQFPQLMKDGNTVISERQLRSALRQMQKTFGHKPTHPFEYRMEPGAAPQSQAGSQQPEQLPQTSQDLTAFVQSLLGEMQTKFQEMSDAILVKIDEMGSKISDLEKSVGDLMQQAGIDQQQQGAAPK
ncbi:putative riken cDNA family protein [Paratrimastix pyriformis]|uniref:Uncharacterized protein n=1 Tax=Paratrimastix pyriformis TaxID=342808 RepID=A0ABQ8ULY8_9EUKA|nr:putative riken cDNA family protein [Paratrimastix pyriformis]